MIIHADMLLRTWKELEYRQDGSTKSVHTEVYEGKLKTSESFTTSHSEVHVSISTYLTHCGRVTQICVFTLQLCKTDDANLRF